MIKTYKPYMDERTLRKGFNLSQGAHFIFTHDIDDECHTLTVANINQIFETSDNLDADSPNHRSLVLMMKMLQEGFHRNRSGSDQPYYPEGINYKYADAVFPKHYQALVEGLSEDSLRKILVLDFSSLKKQGIDPKAGQSFVHQLRNDRLETIFDPEEWLVYSLQSFDAD